MANRVMCRGLTRASALLLAGVALAGCRLDLSARTDVRPDGSGVVAVEAVLDETSLDTLAELGVDPLAELAEVGGDAADDDGWRLHRESTERGLLVRLEREVADGAAIGDAFRELTAGLADEDPALLVDLEVVVADDGGAQVRGTAGLRPPATSGMRLDGEPVGPHGDELAALTEDVVDARLVVRLPGEILTSDADGLDGREAVWRLPVGTSRSVTATAAAPSALARWWPWGTGGALAVAAGVVLLLGVGVAAARRRRLSPAA